ncbi:hypothetical protein U1Q18_026031, partial [Sarracenia purpurea var. burkii]
RLRGFSGERIFISGRDCRDENQGFGVLFLAILEEKKNARRIGGLFFFDTTQGFSGQEEDSDEVVPADYRTRTEPLALATVESDSRRGRKEEALSEKKGANGSEAKKVQKRKSQWRRVEDLIQRRVRGFFGDFPSEKKIVTNEEDQFQSDWASVKLQAQGNQSRRSSSGEDTEAKSGEARKSPARFGGTDRSCRRGDFGEDEPHLRRLRAGTSRCVSSDYGAGKKNLGQFSGVVTLRSVFGIA